LERSTILSTLKFQKYSSCHITGIDIMATKGITNATVMCEGTVTTLQTEVTATTI
jgi:hypothetical protein